MFFVPCGSDFKFVLQGDGGWINWGMYGKFDRNDRVVKMRSGCTDGHVNIGKWRNYASEGVIPSSICKKKKAEILSIFKVASVLSEWQVNNVRNEVHTPAPPKPLRKKNDWEFCSESDECHCDWCTARHSHDGKKRCTPKDWSTYIFF